MRLIGSGDWHITKKCPENRKDTNYFNTILSKVSFMLRYAVKNKIKYIFQPGDFFDDVGVNHAVVSAICEIIKASGIVIITTTGQHDLQFHNSSNPNIPLNVLKSAGLIKLGFNKSEEMEDNIMVHFSGWEQEIPVAVEGYYNILLMHRMVLKDKKVWNAQEKYERSQILLRKYDHNLIICGDNHTAFSSTLNSRYLINCGSLMRSTTAQKKHKPRFFEIDTKTNEKVKVYIPVEKIKDVMDFSKKERELEIDENLMACVENIKTSKKMGMDYKKNVLIGMRKSNLGEGPNKIIQRIMES